MRLFGTSGIRGIYGKEVTPELANSVGLALGTYLKAGKVLVGRDPRTSSLALENAMVSGLESTGITVLRAGMIPTPVLAFVARAIGCDAGVMITASHNPPEYNGIKLFDRTSMAYIRKKEEKIENIISKKSFKRADWKKIGHSSEIEIAKKYIAAAKKSVKISKRFRIVLDCGSGANSFVSPLLLSNYVQKLTKLSCEPNGEFPDRKSEPIRENLKTLSKTVWSQKADMGIAHDGDGDRVAIIDELGRFVPKDLLVALLAKTEMKRGRKIVVPVDTSKLVWDVAEECGAKVVMSRVGDVCVAEKLVSGKGCFGGEPSGCFMFPKFSLCPDGIFASLKILELMSKERRPLSELVDEIPRYKTIRKTIKCKNSEKAKLVKQYIGKLKKIKSVRKITNIDGTRADFKDSWALIRASGTEPKIRITVEAKSRKKANQLLKLLL